MNTPDVLLDDNALENPVLAAFPDAPAGVPSAELIGQVANALFADAPESPTSPAIPAVGAGFPAPWASAPPTLDDAPLDAAFTAAPAVPIPHIGLTGLPAPGLPPVEALPASPGTVPGALLSGQVPAVGERAFLTDIPFEADFGGLPVVASTEESRVDPLALTAGTWPIRNADGLSLTQDSASGGAWSSVAESATPFYFLPATSVPAVTADTPVAFDVHAVRRDFPALQQQVHGKPLIWLDNAATTHKPQAVIDALAHFYAHDNSNIHRGAHTLAERATNAYEAAREKVRRFLGARDAAEIIYVRGATEAINLVAQSYGRVHVGPGDEVLVTELEHHSNIVPWQFLCQATGATLKVIPIDDQGQVVLGAYEQLLGPRTKIVALAHVSNVLGTVLPISVMTQLAHRVGARVLVDGAQGAPHLPVNVQALDADFYVFSGHKLFGPTGIGVLYGKRELLEAMPPWQGGGSMIESVSFEQTTFSPLPAKFEAGTPHIAGAIGLGAAIDYVQRFGVESIAAYEEGLMSYATAALDTIPGLRQIGTTPGKVGALAFVIPGIRSEDIGRALDREGIAVRAGHHCAQPALAHFGLTAAVRPSISLYNTPGEIDALVAAIHQTIKGGSRS